MANPTLLRIFGIIAASSCLATVVAAFVASNSVAAFGSATTWTTPMRAQRRGHPPPAEWASSVAPRAAQIASSGNKPSATPATAERRPSPLPPPPAQLVFPGGGIYFYWQAGAVTHLRESGYDLSSIPMSGASAGALTATLAATGVDFRDATDLALRYAEEAGIWDRPLGLQGVWGPLIERWLDELLPSDAHRVANDIGLQLLVTPVPSFGKTKVTDFEDRSDLIRANMASIHIPWFLDGKLTTRYRDAEHIDGSFLSKASDYMPKIRPKSVVTLEYTRDPAMSDRKMGDFVKAFSKEGIWDLLEKGRKYAAMMDDRGYFKTIPRL